MTSGESDEPGDDVDPPLTLPAEWYRYVIVDGAQESVPGIYEWRIEGVGVYIGKFKHIRRPTREYGLNVQRILRGQPYRKGKPDRFRRIHLALEQAFRAGVPIALTILENPPTEEIDQREAELIRERGTLNGPSGMPLVQQSGDGLGERLPKTGAAADAPLPPKSEELPEVSDPAPGPDMPPKTDRLAEIARMADQLADRVFNAQFLGRPVPESDIHALLEASILLTEHGRDRPALLSEIVLNISGGAPEAAAAEDAAELEDVRRVAQSLRPRQEAKDTQG